MPSSSRSRSRTQRGTGAVLCASSFRRHGTCHVHSPPYPSLARATVAVWGVWGRGRTRWRSAPATVSNNAGEPSLSRCRNKRSPQKFPPAARGRARRQAARQARVRPAPQGGHMPRRGMCGHMPHSSGGPARCPFSRSCLEKWLERLFFAFEEENNSREKDTMVR